MSDLISREAAIEAIRRYGKEKRMSRLSEAERLIQANISAIEKLDNLDLESLDHVIAAMSLDIQSGILRLLAVIADRMEREEDE